MKRLKVRSIEDQDMAGSLAALKRSAQRARRIAAQTHTPLIIYKNGHIEKQMIQEVPLELGSSAMDAGSSLE